MAPATPIAARSQASRRRRENNGSGAGGWVQHAQRFHLNVQENSWNHAGALFQKRPIISLDGSGNKKGLAKPRPVSKWNVRTAPRRTRQALHSKQRICGGQFGGHRNGPVRQSSTS